MRTPVATRSLLLLALVAVAALALVTIRPSRSLLLYTTPVFIIGMLARGRDPRREAEEQAAFEDAERQRAERRAVVTFESFIDQSPVGIELFAPDGRPLHSNKAAERLLGQVPPPGISLFDEKGLKRAGLLEPQLKRVLAGTRVETPPTWYDPTEIGLPGIPGRKVCFRATVFPLFDNEGTVVRIAVMHEDLTEIKRAEQALREAEERTRTAPVHPEPAVVAAPAGADVRDIEFQRRKIEQALRESEERYRSLVESARGYVIVRFTEDGHIAAISPSVEDAWGIKRETIVTDNAAFFSRVHPEDLERVKATEAEVRKTGVYPDGYRLRVLHMTTNAVRWFEVRGSASTFAGRRMLDALLIDITDRKRIEDQLFERERNLAAITASTGEGVFTIDKDWIVRTWSKGAEKETRVAPDEATGKRLWEVYPDLEKSGFGAAYRKALLERVPQYCEGFYQDGRERYAGWFAVSAYPYETGLLVLVRNVSARRRVELAWQEADSKLRALLEQPGLLITLKDIHLRYVFANFAALKALRFGSDAIVGKTDPEIYNSRVSGLLASHDHQVMNTGQPVELELALPDGASPSAVWYHITKQPWRNTGGQVAGIFDIAYDITARVKAQQELARRREYVEKLLADQSQTVRKAQDELARWAK